MKEKINSLTVFLACLCIALMIALGVERQKHAEAQEQIIRMKQEIREMSAQVNEIWVEYMGIVKRLQ